MILGLWWPYPWDVPQIDKNWKLDPSRLKLWQDTGVTQFTGVPPTPGGSQPTMQQMVELCTKNGVGVLSDCTKGNLHPWANYTSGITPISHLKENFTPFYPDQSGFLGYVPMHEKYRVDLKIVEQIVSLLRKKDPTREVHAVGNLVYHLEKQPDFAKAFFQDEKCFYQHEDYINQTGQSFGVQLANWRERLHKLWKPHQSPYNWIAIVCVGDELIDDKPYLIAPTAAGLRSWMYSAKLEGAKRIYFFPGSSGKAKDRMYYGLDVHPHLWKTIKEFQEVSPLD